MSPGNSNKRKDNPVEYSVGSSKRQKTTDDDSDSGISVIRAYMTSRAKKFTEDFAGLDLFNLSLTCRELFNLVKKLNLLEGVGEGEDCEECSLNVKKLYRHICMNHPEQYDSDDEDATMSRCLTCFEKKRRCPYTLRCDICKGRICSRRCTRDYLNDFGIMTECLSCSRIYCTDCAEKGWGYTSKCIECIKAGSSCHFLEYRRDGEDYCGYLDDSSIEEDSDDESDSEAEESDDNDEKSNCEADDIILDSGADRDQETVLRVQRHPCLCLDTLRKSCSAGEDKNIDELLAIYETKLRQLDICKATDFVTITHFE